MELFYEFWILLFATIFFLLICLIINTHISIKFAVFPHNVDTFRFWLISFSIFLQLSFYFNKLFNFYFGLLILSAFSSLFRVWENGLVAFHCIQNCVESLRNGTNRCFGRIWWIFKIRMTTKFLSKSYFIDCVQKGRNLFGKCYATPVCIWINSKEFQMLILIKFYFYRLFTW